LHGIVDKFRITSFFLLNSAKLRSDEALYLVFQKKYKKKLKYKKQLNQVIDDYTISGRWSKNRNLLKLTLFLKIYYF
jgi:hypothetical protein